MLLRRFLIVDDHTLFRESLARMLRETKGVGEVVEAGDADTALAIIAASTSPRERPFDLILVDLILPGISGISLIRLIRKRHLDVPILVLSSVTAPEQVQNALDAGGTAFFCKSGTSREFIDAVDNCFLYGHSPPISRPNDARAEERAKLTPAQETVLNLVCEGLSNPAIAQKLNISVGTVKIHVHAVLRVLGASSRQQAMLIAHRGEADMYRQPLVTGD